MPHVSATASDLLSRLGKSAHVDGDLLIVDDPGSFRGDVIRDLAATATMQDQPRRAILGLVAVTPLHQRHHRRPQIAPLLRQSVFEARGAFLIYASLEDSFVTEPLKARCQYTPGDAEIALKFVESPDAEERIAQDQERPTLADHL